MVGAWRCAGRHGAGERAESATSGSQATCRETGLGWNPPTSPSVRPPNPCQVAPFPNDQAFEYMSLWRPFPFKPPQCFKRRSL